MVMDVHRIWNEKTDAWKYNVVTSLGKTVCDIEMYNGSESRELRAEWTTSLDRYTVLGELRKFYESLLAQGLVDFSMGDKGRDFQTLNIEGLLIDMSMRDESGTLWKPETGVLGVSTIVKVNDPLSKYIAETARVDVSHSEIRECLDLLYLQ